LPGQYFDVESGWNHNGFRDYIPDLGRYAEPDPLGRLGSGNNVYAYVYDNPMNLADLFGLSSKCLLDPKSRCAKLFQQMFNMTAAQFNDAASKIPWYLLQNLNSPLGSTAWNQIAHNGDNSLISESFSGTSNEAVTAAGGKYLAPVVLGPDWFLDTPARQIAVKLHEAVHSITGWSDSDVFNVFSKYGLPSANFQKWGNTDDFTQWLLAGCPGS
jgi:RHS repeat-associated protein